LIKEAVENAPALQSLPKLRKPGDLLNGIADTSRHYNDLIHFAPNEPTLHKFCSEVRTARDTIERVLSEAVEKIKREWCDMKSISAGIETLTLKDDHW